MKQADVYALGLALLGAWGIFSSRRSFQRAPGWSARRLYMSAVGTLLVAGCFLPAGALWCGWFAPWMLLPLGASFLGMIPMPCYWEAVDRIGWLHAARTILFVAVAVACLGIALGWVPLRWLGL
jgi:hypothetical protein